MITPEQRKKLEEEAVAYWQDDLAKFFPTSKGPTGSEKIMFLAGAEALARIQSTPKEGDITPAEGGSDEVKCRTNADFKDSPMFQKDLAEMKAESSESDEEVK